MKNSKLRRVLLLVACAVLLVSLSVGATLAYLTYETEEVKNTFTVGKVEISLDETDVNEYGVATGNPRDTANEYKLLPGHAYTKDPQVHVISGSEPAYIRILVEITDMTDLAAACGVAVADFMPENFVEGWNASYWPCYSMTVENNVCKLEFRYNGIVDALNAQVDLLPLFNTIKVPGTATNAQIAALSDMEINIIAHAMQADGFDTADDAWAKWGN